MVRMGWCRTFINQQTGRIKRMFKWAARQEMIPADGGRIKSGAAALHRLPDGVLTSEPCREGLKRDSRHPIEDNGVQRKIPQILIPRLRCPHCRSTVVRSYGLRLPADGTDDAHRYYRCKTCGERFVAIITDDPGIIPTVGNTPFEE